MSLVLSLLTVTTVPHGEMNTLSFRSTGAVRETKETAPELVDESKIPIARTYPVFNGKAESVARTLQEVFASDPQFRAAPIGNDAIMVWATPEVHCLIWSQPRPENRRTRVIEVSYLNVKVLENILKVMFAEPTYIEADAERKAIVTLYWNEAAVFVTIFLLRYCGKIMWQNLFFA